MKMNRDTARAIRAWIPGAVGVRGFKIEGSFRCGTTHDGVDAIDTNRLAFPEADQDLFDFMTWADVQSHDHTPVDGEVELDLYVYSLGHYGQLEDVVVAKFDADGLVSIHDHDNPRHTWERPTLLECARCGESSPLDEMHVSPDEDGQRTVCAACLEVLESAGGGA